MPRQFAMKAAQVEDIPNKQPGTLTEGKDLLYRAELIILAQQRVRVAVTSAQDKLRYIRYTEQALSHTSLLLIKGEGRMYSARKRLFACKASKRETGVHFIL